MNSENYLISTETKLSKYFNITKSYNHVGLNIDLFALSFIRNERYMLSRKATIYTFENYEYVFVKSFKDLELGQLNRFLNALKEATKIFAHPIDGRMSTVITGVLVLDNELEESLKPHIKKFKFERSFSFGFKGWTYIRLVTVDLSKGEVITNKRGKEVKKFYKII